MNKPKFVAAYHFCRQQNWPLKGGKITYKYNVIICPFTMEPCSPESCTVMTLLTLEMHRKNL